MNGIHLIDIVAALAVLVSLLALWHGRKRRVFRRDALRLLFGLCLY